MEVCNCSIMPFSLPLIGNTLKHVDYPISSTLDSQSTNYPFTQMILCRKLANDSFPSAIGTVAYFDPSFSSCPQSFASFESAAGNRQYFFEKFFTFCGKKGRFIVPGWDNADVEANSVSPLQSGQDLIHSHSFSTNFTATDVSYAGNRNDALNRII